jgi:hypothetical protein
MSFLLADLTPGAPPERSSDESANENDTVVHGCVLRRVRGALAPKLPFEFGEQVISETRHLSDEYTRSHGRKKDLLFRV